MKLYVLLTKFPDNGSKMIELLTGGYYPHASIGLEEDLNTFYSFVSKGFIVEKIARYVRPDREPFPCQLYELEVSDEVYRSVKKLLQSFVALKSYLYYSKFGLVLSLLHIPYKKTQFGYFCTQFVAHVLQSSGAAKLKKSCSRYFSEDIKKLPGMKLNHQGNLQTMLAHCNISPCAV